MQKIEGTDLDEPHVASDDEIFDAPKLAHFLGYALATVKHYSSPKEMEEHPDRLPPRIGGISRPLWLKSEMLSWCRRRSIKVPPEAKTTPVRQLPALLPRARAGRPRKIPAH